MGVSDMDKSRKILSEMIRDHDGHVRDRSAWIPIHIENGSEKNPRGPNGRRTINIVYRPKYLSIIVTAVAKHTDIGNGKEKEFPADRRSIVQRIRPTGKANHNNETTEQFDVDHLSKQSFSGLRS